MPPINGHAADDVDTGELAAQAATPGTQVATLPGPRSGADDITITITGPTAAKMLGRGDAEQRILAELAALRERLAGIESAATRQIAGYQALSTTVESLQEQVAQLKGRMADEVAVLRTELARLRTDLDAHAGKTVPLPDQVERIRGQVSGAQMQIAQLGVLPDRLNRLELDLARLEEKVNTPQASVQVEPDPRSKRPRWFWDSLDKWRPSDKPAIVNGEATERTSSWRQRLNSLWLW